MAPEIKRYRLTVRGQVQGIGLRWQIKLAAEKLDLGGWVKNQAKVDELVAEVEGELESVRKFISWLRTNPGGAEIKDMQIIELSPRLESAFKIKQSIWPFL